jgi:sortase A
MKSSNNQKIIEQIALLIASLVWTVVVLTGIVLFWVYQDVQARWQYVLSAPPEALAQAAPPTATATPTATLWAGPGPTLTPTSTKPPTPTATWVIQPPDILPETLNPDEPTPIPVIVHTEDEAAEFGLDQPEPTLIPPAATPVPPQATQQPVQNPAPTPVPPTATPPPPPPAAPAPESPPAIGDAPTRLVIDSVGIDSEVIPVGWSVVEQNGQQYSIWQVADYAVGWHKTTAPLGQPGNSVMAGHHNVNGEVFRDLVNIEVGDKVTAYAGDKKYEYVVELKTIVKEKGEPLEVRQRNAQWIAPTNDERLTFVTCWPYTNNTHRVIVVARPL